MSYFNPVRRIGPVLAGGLLLSFSVGCSETQPTLSGRFPLVPGPHVFISRLRSSDELRPDCPLPAQSVSYVTLSLEGNTWIVRSESAENGNLELRFVEKPLGPRPIEVDVSGTAQGTSRDRFSAMTFSSVAGGPGLLTGGTDGYPVPMVSGMIHGSIFADFPPIGSGTCSLAEWTVRRPQECEVTRTCNQ